MTSNPTIIGIDGGASKISAHVIEYDGKSFSLGKYHSTKEYRYFSDFINNFSPIPLKTQLSQLSSSIELTNDELIQTKAYYSAIVEAVVEIIKKTKSNKNLIGIGMPGIKSDDKRGIVAMANGPRMPNFTNEIEQRLFAEGIALAKPITKLGSDADYCGIGEEYADEGAFKNVDNAYYLGGGTGVADALKLKGNLTTFDNNKDWIAKTWEMSDNLGNSLEKYFSANGIQSLFAETIQTPQEQLISDKIFIDEIIELAEKGNDSAISVINSVSTKIAELLYERVSTLHSGWQNKFKLLNLNKPKLISNHKYKNIVFDKIVIGQRLGFAMQTELGKQFLLQPISSKLTQFIKNDKILSVSAKDHYLINSGLRDRIIVLSKLREAPALGAGIDAYTSYFQVK